MSLTVKLSRPVAQYEQALVDSVVLNDIANALGRTEGSPERGEIAISPTSEAQDVNSAPAGALLE